MFIDIHVHVQKVDGPLRGGKPRFSSPEHLIKRYDAVGIERGVLLPDVNPECNWMIQSNEEISESVFNKVARENAIRILERAETWRRDSP